MTEVLLGAKVRDKVTGLEGIAVSRHDYLYGCTRISIQPEVDKDGKVPDIHTCDAPQLEIVGEPLLKTDEQLKEKGGPDKFMDPGKSVPSNKD